MGTKNNSGKGNSKKYLLSIGFMLVLIIATYCFIFRNYEFSSLIETLKTVDIRFIYVGVILALVFLSGNGLCIREIMKSLGCEITLPRSFIYSSIDFYYSSITPSATGGQPMMAYYMAKDGLPLSKSSLAMVLTVMEYMLSLVILAIVAIICVPQFVFTAQTVFIVLLIIGIIITALLSVGCALVMFKGQYMAKPCKWLINLGAKLHIIKDKEATEQKGRETLTEYRDAATYMRHNPKVLAKVMTISVLQRIALFGVSWCVYRALGFNSVGFVEIVAIQTLVTVATSTIPLPGAVCVSEGIFLLMYDHIYTDSGIRTTAMLLTRVISFYFCVILCGTLTLYNHMRLLLRDQKIKRKFKTMIGFFNYTVITTYCGLLSGVYGIFCAFTHHPRYAVVFLMISALLDMFTEPVTRTAQRSGIEKSYGLQIVSLTRLVCFGILPTAIGFSLGLNNFWFFLLFFIFILASLIKLGYSNVIDGIRLTHPEKMDNYPLGMPMAASALIFSFAYSIGCFTHWLVPLYAILLGITALLYLLKLKFPKLHSKEAIILLLAGILSFILVLCANV